jgi:hypothetical protein
MRKALLFVIAVAMIVGGVWWLVGEQFIAQIIHFKLVIASTILMALGAYLLWDDFMKHPDLEPKESSRDGEGRRE